MTPALPSPARYYAGNSLAITSLCAGPEGTLITGGYDTIANQWQVETKPGPGGDPAQGVLASIVGHASSSPEPEPEP